MRFFGIVARGAVIQGRTWSNRLYERFVLVRARQRATTTVRWRNWNSVAAHSLRIARPHHAHIHLLHSIVRDT